MVKWFICKLCGQDYRSSGQNKREHLASHGLTVKVGKAGGDQWTYYFTKPELLT